MNIKRFTVKSIILWFLLPLFIIVLVIITFTANQILTNVLLDKFNGEKETIFSNASLLVEQIHEGYAMLDLQLEGATGFNFTDFDLERVDVFIDTMNQKMV